MSKLIRMNGVAAFGGGPEEEVEEQIDVTLCAGPVLHDELWAELDALTDSSDDTRLRVIGDLIESFEIFKGRERRPGGRVWYALPQHLQELEGLTDGGSPFSQV
jgi:hypothetical protein